ALSQEELAERAGLSVETVGVLERGVRRRPQPRTIRALADALGLTGEERGALLAAARSPVGPPAEQDPPTRAGVPTGAADTVPSPPAGMPASLTSFVGRERELTAVGLLLAGGRRLMTLTGPGGAGKTRLAVEAARAVAHNFPDGVCF